MGSALSNLLSASTEQIAPAGNNHQAFFVVGVGEWDGGDCPPH